MRFLTCVSGGSRILDKRVLIREASVLGWGGGGGVSDHSQPSSMREFGFFFNLYSNFSKTFIQLILRHNFLLFTTLF